MRKESEAQDELAAALKALAAKRQHSVDLEAQAIEARITAGKKRYDQLSAKLASSDASEQMAAFDAAMSSEDESLQMAAFDAAMSSEDESLRRVVLAAAFRSGNDDLQGTALAAYIAAMPQISISVTYKDSNDKTFTYVQTLRITEVSGASFAGEFSTPRWSGQAQASGTVQSDTLSLNASWDEDTSCAWTARVDENGTLTGLMQCAYRGHSHDRNPGGNASVSF